MLLQSALYDSHDPFHLFERVETVRTPEELKEGACLLLHGGADISPSLYNHKVSKYCHASATLSRRDEQEKALLDRAIELEMPIIGICRGAQLLCATDGGHLVQHIVGHAANGHEVVSPIYGKMGESNTAHHQMMVPRESRENTIIGWVEETITGYEQEDKLRAYDKCPEVIWFGALNGLGIQGHPEWMEISKPFMQKLQRVVKDYLKV